VTIELDSDVRAFSIVRKCNISYEGEVDYKKRYKVYNTHKTMLEKMVWVFHKHLMKKYTLYTDYVGILRHSD